MTYLSLKKCITCLLLVLPLLLAPPASATASSLQTSSTIMVLGDSISAAYGIAREQGWVKLLENHLQQQYNSKNYQVVNASISGETTAGALSRLPKLLAQYQPAIVIIELGGNDGLRGFPITQFRQNLEQLITLAQTAEAKVLLTGMRIPPNYGPRYTQMFYASYGEMAQNYNVPLVPFLLEEIAIHPELMQKDGIHPVAAAQAQILHNVLMQLEALL